MPFPPENNTPKNSHNINTIQAINQILTERLTCDTEEDLGMFCLSVAEELSQSEFGFIGELNVLGKFDTIALSNPGWLECSFPKTDIPLLIKGFFTNAPSDHPQAVGVPEGHPPLTSFLGAPLFRKNKIIGMLALGNKPTGYDQSDLKAITTLSIAIVEALFSKRAEDAYKRQSQEIMELSTPVFKVWEGVIAAPLIGVLDSERTRNFLERFLNEIVQHHAPYALIDITGVPSVDTLTAQNLLEAITAARLLGTNVVLTGVRPPIAQTMVHLGINLEQVDTKASFSEGLKLCLKRLNIHISER
jgi:anti-anti-sigma regulatory factor